MNSPTNNVIQLTTPNAPKPKRRRPVYGIRPYRPTRWVWRGYIGDGDEPVTVICATKRDVRKTVHALIDTYCAARSEG